MPDAISAITGQTPTASGGNLTQQAADENLAAIPSIDALTRNIQAINQNAYLSVPGRSEALATIQNRLAGNLDPSTIYNAQLNNAQRYGAGGFSSDSPAWQTAVQRALGLDREALITAGQQGLNAFYAQMPVADPQAQMTSPALIQQQQATAAQQALQAQQIANQVAQFAAAQAQQAQQFGVTSGLTQQQIQNQAAQYAANLAQQQQQFAQSLAQQASQFGTTSAQNAAHLYAGTYGTIPGYNQYGQYTGQTGTYPTATYTPSPSALAVDQLMASIWGPRAAGSPITGTGLSTPGTPTSLSGSQVTTPATPAATQMTGFIGTGSRSDPYRIAPGTPLSSINATFTSPLPGTAEWFAELQHRNQWGGF